jgi:hypothetical protein
MRCALLLLAMLLAATVLAPPTASASHSRFTLFEANRELRSDDPHVRSQTLDEISMRSGCVGSAC